MVDQAVDAVPFGLGRCSGHRGGSELGGNGFDVESCRTDRFGEAPLPATQQSRPSVSGCDVVRKSWPRTYGIAATDRAPMTIQRPPRDPTDEPPASAIAAAIDPMPIDPASSGIRRRLRLRISNQSSRATSGATTSRGTQNESPALAAYTTKAAMTASSATGSSQPAACEAANASAVPRARQPLPRTHSPRPTSKHSHLLPPSSGERPRVVEADRQSSPAVEEQCALSPHGGGRVGDDRRDLVKAETSNMAGPDQHQRQSTPHS